MVLNEFQRLRHEEARQFSREYLLPRYQQREQEAHMDRAILREMGKRGFIGLDFPKQYGGSEADSVTLGIVLEAVAAGDFNIGAITMVQSLCGAILQKNAGSEIVDAWLPRIAKGDAILSIAITEPDAGSDAGAIRLPAKRDGDYYVLNGEKSSITFVDCADAFVVMARTGTIGEGAKGCTAFFVPANTPGVSHVRSNDLGSHISGRGSLFLDNVRIPADFRLGAEGRGFIEVMSGFDFSRALVALLCIGAAQASLDETWAYTRERNAFGGPIARFQGVTFPLVDWEIQLAACRQLAYHALTLRDNGQPNTVETAMVKALGPRAAFDAIHQCILTFGHYGWTMDLPHQQRLRDVMGLEFGEGTASIMKLIVATAKAGKAARQP